MPKRSVDRKRNKPDDDDTINTVYTDWQEALSQRKQKLLKLHKRELKLVERENAYLKSKMDKVQAIEADHESRIEQYIQIMKEVENEVKELPKRETELMKREELLVARESALQTKMECMKTIATSDDDIVKLDVGGTDFDVKRGTLCAVEGSLLSSMFGWRSAESKMKRNDAADGRIFLDWDPDDFNVILNELEADAGDSDRKMKISDPSVEIFWRYLLTPKNYFFRVKKNH